MILNVKHKGIKLFIQTGSQKGINPAKAEKILYILTHLGACSTPQEMRLPGLKLHKLKGEMKDCYAVSVSSNWRITFRFIGENVADVDYQDYH